MTEYGRIHTDGSRSGGQLLLEIQSRPNLDGYYFSFEPTGNTHIDTVLGAVGFAGKMFHGTEAWDENIPHYGVGFSCISNIQNAANAAAKALSQPTQSDALREANRALRLGLYGLIDSEDADAIAVTLEAGGEVDWSDYPESTHAALGYCK